jgi:hypothetical protein
LRGPIQDTSQGAYSKKLIIRRAVSIQVYIACITYLGSIKFVYIFVVEPFWQVSLLSVAQAVKVWMSIPYNVRPVGLKAFSVTALSIASLLASLPTLHLLIALPRVLAAACMFHRGAVELRSCDLLGLFWMSAIRKVLSFDSFSKENFNSSHQSHNWDGACPMSCSPGVSMFDSSIITVASPD